MKAARTILGAKAARSHAAALAGSSEVLDAVLKQAGVIKAEEINELLDVAAALLCYPLPRGNKTGILSEGGGMGVVATDVCIKFGIEVASLSPSTMSKLNTILPSRWPHGNPVDMVAASDVTYPCLWAMLEDEGIDAVLLVGGISDKSNAWILNSLAMIPSSMRDRINPQLRSREAAQLENLDLAIERMHHDRKPIIFCLELTRDTVASRAYAKLQQNGIPVYPTVERGARVLAHLAWYGEYLKTVRPQAISPSLSSFFPPPAPES